MSNPTLYDDDILLWSEQQAAVIRRLGTTRAVPNDLDIENVAEEIESVGRSELAAVKSHLRLIFAHFVKLVARQSTESEHHWRNEIRVFHSEMMERYAPSMRQRIDLDKIWRLARESTLTTEEEQEFIAGLPAQPPFVLDELVTDRFDIFGLVERLRKLAKLP